jgi:hypothetical protein
MFLMINTKLVHREIDKCYFSNEAFKAYFLNDTGNEIINHIKSLEGIDEFELLEMSESVEQRNTLQLFIDECISHSILRRQSH